MLTYCDNPVKLIALAPGEDQVVFMIRHTRQILTKPWTLLESDWSEAKGGRNLEITLAMNELHREHDEFIAWMKLNG